MIARMAYRAGVGAVVVAVALAAGCSAGDAPGAIPHDPPMDGDDPIVGTWVAYAASQTLGGFKYPTGPLGYSMTLICRPDGTVTATATEPGDTHVGDGRWERRGETYLFTAHTGERVEGFMHGDDLVVSESGVFLWLRRA